MQGLFEDAVVNGWLHRRAALHEVVRRPGEEPQGGAARAGASEMDASSDESDAWEPDQGLSDGGGEVDDDFDNVGDDEEEEEEDEDDIEDFGEFLPQGVHDNVCSPVGSRQQKAPVAHVSHCLKGGEPVRDSKLWLNAQDDCVVQRFDGVQLPRLLPFTCFVSLLMCPSRKVCLQAPLPKRDTRCCGALASARPLSCRLVSQNLICVHESIWNGMSS